MLETFPDWLAPVWGFLTGLLVLWSVLMLVAPLVTRRPRITFEAVLAIALAILLGLLAARSRRRAMAGRRSGIGPRERASNSPPCGWPRRLR